MSLSGPAPTSSLTDAVTTIAADAPVTAAAFLGRTPAFALGDGAVLLAEIGDTRRVDAHPDGAVLAATVQGSRWITGGDDGRVVATDAAGGTVEIARESGWIDAVAARQDGTVAWASGRTVRARTTKGEVKSMQSPSSARGLAFAPKGYRLAMAHYNGASLWYPNTGSEPEALAWKGSHLDITFSPDGRFVVTSMQENALHGWRLADGQHMRMQGYPAKTRSFDWSMDGAWLATSGADACIVWPFDSKTGPMGKSPRECGVRPARITQVRFHPKTLVVAMGYEDGFILLCRLSDGSEILVRKTERGNTDAISALAWDADGRRLIFGTRQGAAGLLTLPA